MYNPFYEFADTVMEMDDSLIYFHVVCDQMDMDSVYKSLVWNCSNEWKQEGISSGQSRQKNIYFMFPAF